jgi:preprotein translocase subunit SecD
VAGIIGLAAVMLWMILFYRLPGVVAAIALTLYAIFFLALIKLIPVTLTLAGVAGFILSIGMAVDANVLIFERFRENLRAGKAVPYALKDGFKKAWDSIRASNISSLITGLILYGFGTSIVRGFALTFSLGILLSMFTAVVITKGMLDVLLTSKRLHKPVLLGAHVKESESL